MTSLSELEERYASMSPDEFAALNRANLTEIAQVAYDKEVGRRRTPEWLAKQAEIAAAAPKSKNREMSLDSFGTGLAWNLMQMVPLIGSLVLVYALGKAASGSRHVAFLVVGGWLLIGIGIVTTTAMPVVDRWFLLGALHTVFILLLAYEIGWNFLLGLMVGSLVIGIAIAVVGLAGTTVGG